MNSGTSAIEIPLRALGVDGGEVLVPANTFFATAAAVIAAGGRPRFVDCDPATMALDPIALEAAIGPDTVGVDRRAHRWPRDAGDPRHRARCATTTASGSSRTPPTPTAAASTVVMAGTFGVAGSFSFYPTKVMTAGEGGMIVTDDDRIADEARIYRDQGKAGFLTNLHTRLGYNWRMSEPHAAIAVSQLRRLDEFIAHRQHVAARYDAAVVQLRADSRSTIPDTARLQLLQVRRLPARRRRPGELKQVLREEYGVGLSGEVYELPLHLQPVFAPWADGRAARRRALCARHICLPISAVTHRRAGRHRHRLARSALAVDWLE